MKRALIIGISGQDGAYLAALLLDKGYDVWGTSRDADQRRFSALEWLGIDDRVRILSMAPTDLQSVIATLRESVPDEIYNLAAQSSVGLSFDQPVETIRSIIDTTQNLLEALRLTRSDARFYSAGSSEVFGDGGGGTNDEDSRFHPRSPYGVAKAAAFWQVATYREAYGLFAATGILFNHESPLRGARFVTSKIVTAALAIHRGLRETLTLGDTSIVRDWGWAPDYVDAMWRMLQVERAQDYVVATGHAMSLAQFTDAAFGYFGLEAAAHVRHDPALCRPNELRYNCGDASRAMAELGWKPSVSGIALVERLCRAVEERAPPGGSVS